MADERDAERQAASEGGTEHRGLFSRLHDWFVSSGRGDGRFEVRATAESHFSWLRTRMSLERTLMSWVRTSTALIAFGFTIVQFFANLQHMAGAKASLRPEMARYMGLALIALGVLCTLIALWQYRSFLQYLWNKDFAVLAGIAKAPIETPVFVVAICIVLIGCYAFLAVLIRAV